MGTQEIPSECEKKKNHSFEGYRVLEQATLLE